ncbi:nitrous oxide reductase accessory protein NosL [Shinella curvata]|uniref:Nitrous oxide reductase accessory protein NosL n=1 Tax=Shinella curvata TaxID=1817964 RepID=A0ABT8XHQ5_9HYPH|nr:nitrous oxide reductase accessory protein NosL [Shinella curvata]MCJ8056129.1 nitrous oxide reductase accessory protein NosL [Shinella curvata]MDO6123270.1 nitrous oxide reductase accessory protein NosL [Shinella curvata]
MRISLRSALFVGAFALLAGCKEEVVQATAPQDMTPETLGHYCQMNLLEHPGPKAQVFLEGNAAPLFFSQVRDAIAYMRGPEQVAPILAVYVNDMGKAGAAWDRPGDGNWIAADTAFYVLGSARAGGMGAPEAVPFSSRERAEDFVRAEGGQVLTLADITNDMVLAPVEAGADQGDEDDADFDGRLRVLQNKAGG